MHLSNLTALAALALAPSLAADTLTARLVDSSGVGIANGDVDALDRDTDLDVPLTGDSSDVNGFINVTIPPGRYDLTFQGPVGSNYFEVLIRNVDIAGTVDLGTIVLDDGFHVSGRVLDQFGFPVANCDLDAINLSTGLMVTLTGDKTDLFGNFNTLVPLEAGVIFDPRGVLGPTLAPRRIDYSLQGDTAVGDITLLPGLVVSGTIRRSNGQVVAGAGVDFTDSAGEPVFLHGDRSDAFGNFSVVAAADTYEVQVCPPNTSTLASMRLDAVTVSGPTQLGTLTLPDGLLVHGTLRNGAGQPVPGADVDLIDATSGVSMPLCGDGTSPLGTYAVRIPTGTYHVLFTKPGEFAVRRSVVVTAQTLVDEVTVPSPRASSTVRVGSGVNPVVLQTLSLPRVARKWTVALDCSGHAPNLGIILLHEESHPGLLTFAGEFLVTGALLGVNAAPHTGNVLTFSTPIAPNAALCGLTGSAQGIVLGAPGPQLTNALDLVIGY